MTRLLAIYAIQVAATVDNVLVAPTLVHNLRALCEAEAACDDVMASYGRCQVLYFGSRVVAQMLVGRFIDGGGGRTYARAAGCCLAGACAASAGYAAAPVVGGVAAVVAARALMGAASAISVVTMAFVSQTVPARERTPVFSTIMGLQRLTSLLGPAFVLGLHEVAGSWEYAGAGVVVGCFNVAAFLLAATLDGGEDDGGAKRGKLDDGGGGAVAIVRSLARSGAYTCFALSWNNNFNNQTLDWSLPIVTTRLYGASPFRDSLLFGLTGTVGTASAFLIGPLSRRYALSDRSLCVFNQVLVGACLAAYAALFGCPSLSGAGATRPLWLFATVYTAYHVPFLAQMPSNNSIFTKLVATQPDRAAVGFYVALLEIFKGLARAFAGYFVGRLAADDPCALWLVTLATFALQFLPVALSWEQLGDVDRPTAPA